MKDVLVVLFFEVFFVFWGVLCRLVELVCVLLLWRLCFCLYGCLVNDSRCFVWSGVFVFRCFCNWLSNCGGCWLLFCVLFVGCVLFLFIWKILGLFKRFVDVFCEEWIELIDLGDVDGYYYWLNKGVIFS